MRARAVLLHPRTLPVMERGSGVRTVHLVSREIGAAQFLNGTSEFDPGGAVPFHSHNCEESVVILEGVATFETDEATAELAAGQATWVPAGVVHRFRNRGDSVMRFLWTYGRADATRTLAATGETVAIGSAEELGAAERADGHTLTASCKT
jgi:quercetin dioxygenase-like cupin family protein